MPAVDWDKTAALESWLERMAEPLVFFFGDDLVDEPVHEAVRRRHGGVSVAVGRSSSLAEYALPDSTQVVWFLEWLAREWREAAPRG